MAGPYNFRKVLVWDVLPGGATRVLRNGTVSVYDATGIDPTAAGTGPLLTTLTSDSDGVVTYTHPSIPTVDFVSPRGFVSRETSPDSFAEASTAAASAAASASSAASSATSAQNAANLVGAPADSAISAAATPNSGSSTDTTLTNAYPRLSAPKKDAPAFGLYYPEAHGAVGDGVTDDSAAINATISAANAAKGGTVYFTGTYAVTSSVNCSGISDVELLGTTRARTTGSGLVWRGADSGSLIKADNANGFSVKGLSLTASSSTFAGILIDFTNTIAMPQAFHVNIEWNFFAGGGGNLHTSIHTGGGHNYDIRRNDFYKHNIAIQGFQQSLTPAQSVQSVLVERNWFEAHAGTCHIADPGTGWRITTNAVEPREGGAAGFVRLLNAAPSMVNVTIEDNWCGDVTVAGGSQIEIAKGPFTIRNNLLGVFGATPAIKAVGAVTNGGCHITDNRYTGNTAGTFIDWGAFSHTATVVRLANDVPSGVTPDTGTKPPALIADASGGLSFRRPPWISYGTVTSGSVTIDPTAGEIHYMLLGANLTTMTISPNPVYNGAVLTVIIQQNGTGGWTYNYDTKCRFAGSAKPTGTTAFSTNTVTFVWDGGKWLETSRAAAVG